MKYLILVLSLLLISCQEPKYREIGQEILDGKVSAVKEGVGGRTAQYPRIWIQTAKTTKEIEIPFSYEGRWKVGDSCLLIIEKYEVIKEK